MKMNNSLLDSRTEFIWTHKITITRVVDGDTVKADVDLGHNVILTDQTIRFAGIDTPEKRGDTKLIGAAVTDYVKLYVARMTKRTNNKVWFRSTEKKDSFGRMIGVIYFGSCNNESLNEHLLHRGLARAYKSNIAFNEKLLLEQIRTTKDWLSSI
jgi:micrococcal nuclease